MAICKQCSKEYDMEEVIRFHGGACSLYCSPQCMKGKPKGFARNPLYFNVKDEKWYFWNEVWTDLIGPYGTQEDARAALKKYCVEELGT